MPRPIFFCHIPKTAGTWLRTALQRGVRDHEIVPDPCMMARGGNRYPDYRLVATTLRSQGKAVRLVCGHYPLSARELLDDPVTVTVLREPVARTISHLKHLVVVNGVPIATIHETLDRGEFPYHSNLMTRLLGPGVASAPLQTLNQRYHALMREPIANPAAAVERALANLRRIDVLGLTEHLDLLIGPLKDLGVRVRIRRMNVSKAVDLGLSPAQLETVRAHNELDTELYRAARDILGV